MNGREIFNQRARAQAASRQSAPDYPGKPGTKPGQVTKARGTVRSDAVEPPEGWITIARAAAEFDRAPYTLRIAVREGRLDGKKIGRFVIVRRDQVAAMVEDADDPERKAARLAAARAAPRFPRVYVSGPISGMPGDNRDAFERARAALAADPAIRVVVPFDLYEPRGAALKCPAIKWCQAMVACINALERCAAIYMLDGWQRSAGAWREYEIATARRLKVFFERRVAP